jgi:hypothetical protein
VPWCPLGGLSQFKKFNEHTGNQNRDLPSCSKVLQQTTLPHAPSFFLTIYIYIHIHIRSLLASEFQVVACSEFWKLIAEKQRLGLVCNLSQVSAAYGTQSVQKKKKSFGCSKFGSVDEICRWFMIFWALRVHYAVMRISVTRDNL